MRLMLSVQTFVAVRLLVGCAGDTDPADRIAATSARLKGHGVCAADTCDYRFEWTTCTRPFLDLECAPYDASRRLERTNIALPSTTTEYRFSNAISSLTPNTLYRFRVCGRASQAPDYECFSERDFATGSEGQPASPMYNQQGAQAAGSMSHPFGANQGRDVGNAVVFSDRALYYFGDTWAPTWWRTSTAAYGTRGWFAGDFPPLADATLNDEHFQNGVPKQFIPYTESEPEFVYNVAVQKNERQYHWPTSNFVRRTDSGEEGLVFWSRGGFDGGEHRAGTYVDRIRPGDSTTRGAEGRALLWPRGEADGYLPIDIEGGGYRYFITCKTIVWSARCFLARVAPGQATDAAAYRYYDGSRRSWVAEQVSRRCNQEACPAEVQGGLFEGSPYMAYQPSITWNPYLRKYLAVAGDGGGIELRVAERLTGPWSQPTSVPATPEGRYGFLARTAAEGLDNYHAREHLHLRSADAKTIVVSYFHAAETNSPENRAVKLVKIELER